jgi:hypothetical protein
MSINSTMAGSCVSNPNNQQSTTNDFASTAKRAHHFRSRDAYLGKASSGKIFRIKKFLDSFGHENATGHNSHKNGAAGAPVMRSSCMIRHIYFPEFIAA